MTGLYVGQAIGGFGATVAAAFSWHTTFHWFGILGIAYSVVLLLLLHDKDKDTANVACVSRQKPAKGGLFQGLSVVLSTWAFWVILFYFAVPSLPGWATKNWLPTLFAENLGVPMSEAGPMSTITIAVSSLFGVLFGGVLSDKWVQQEHPWPCLYQCHRFGYDHSCSLPPGLRSQCGSQSWEQACSSVSVTVCLMPTICQSSVRLSRQSTGPQHTVS